MRGCKGSAGGEIIARSRAAGLPGSGGLTYYAARLSVLFRSWLVHRFQYFHVGGSWLMDSMIRGFCLFALLLASGVLPCPAAEPIDPKLGKSSPASTKAGEKKFVWYDIQLLGLQGQGWHGKDLAQPYDRLPAKAEMLVRKAVWDLSRDSTGIYVHFISDAPSFQARWTCTRKNLAMPHMPATGVSGLDLYARTPEGWRWIANGRPAAQSTTAPFGNVDPLRREYLLYLPLYNGVTSVELGIPEGAHLWKSEPVSSEQALPVVVYGTSITQGGCASRPGMVHTAILQRRLDRPVINLGFSGNGKMELELARLLAEIDAALYVIDCIPNLVPKETALRTEPFLRELSKLRPKTPILLVEDRTYPHSVLSQGMRETQAANRRALKAAYDKLTSEKVPHLFYLAGGSLLASDGEGTVDGSHPTDLGFVQYADAFEPVWKRILKSP